MGIVRGLGWVLAGLADFLLGALSLVAWLATIGLILSSSWWAIASLTVAVGGTASFVWLTRRLWIGRPRPTAPATDTAIQAAIASLPPGTQVPRSRAATPGGASYLGWGVYALGLVAALVTSYAGASAQEYSPGTPGTEPYALAILGVSGLAAGALLSLARNSRGDGTSLRKILIAPVALALLAIFGSDGSSGSTGYDLGERLLLAATVFAVTGVPLLSGFLLTRRVVTIYRSGRVDFSLQPSKPAFPAELEAATDQRSVAALVREYAQDAEGSAYLAADRAALDGAGYDNTATGERWDRWRDEPMTVALFVRRDAVSSLQPPSAAEHPDRGVKEARESAPVSEPNAAFIDSLRHLKDAGVITQEYFDDKVAELSQQHR